MEEERERESCELVKHERPIVGGLEIGCGVNVTFQRASTMAH